MSYLDNNAVDLCCSPGTLCISLSTCPGKLTWCQAQRQKQHWWNLMKCLVQCLVFRLGSFFVCFCWRQVFTQFNCFHPPTGYSLRLGSVMRRLLVSRLRALNATTLVWFQPKVWRRAHGAIKMCYSMLFPSVSDSPLAPLWCFVTTKYGNSRSHVFNLTDVQCCETNFSQQIWC